MTMPLTPSQFTKQAINTCEHYGFRQANAWKQLLRKHKKESVLTHTASAADRCKDGIAGILTNGLNTYVSERFNHNPDPTFYYSVEPYPRTGETTVSLQIFGVEKSIGEAILIQTIRSLLADSGFTEHSVRINSLGDSDSQTRYTRELNNFLRRRLNEMTPAARDLMKEGPTAALLHLIQKEEDLAYKSPSPLEYLTDQSRRHFREIVEYLEISDTPYEIDPRLMGNYECYNDALFTIDINDESGLALPEQPFQIFGGRYDGFCTKHLKNSVPAVGAVVVLKNQKAPSRIPRSAIPKPSIYVVQLGFGPKVRSLLLIEQLRQAGILVNQNLASDSLSTQLREAEDRGARFTLIIGQKEYVDGTVILRDMKERNQEYVPIDILASKLKRMASK